MTLRVVVVGEEATGIAAIRKLASHPECDLVGVVANPRSEQEAGASTWSTAASLEVERWPGPHIVQPGFDDVMRDLEIDLLLNVYSMHILGAEVLRTPRIGCFNVHPGPLPAYAGVDVVSWAIYNGETSHGVTLHRMSERVDAGAIAYEAEFAIGPDDSALSVFRRCSTESVKLVMRLVDDAVHDRIREIPQALAERRYFRHEVPDQGRLAWDRPARRVVDFVRACEFQPFPSPWGHPHATLNAERLEILRARRTGDPCDGAPPGATRPADAGGVQAACADEWVLLQQVRWRDRVMPASEVVPAHARIENGR